MQLTMQWLQLVKTNHDVNVRVSDKVDLQGLPLECNLMAISNQWDFLAVGSSSGMSGSSGVRAAADFRYPYTSAKQISRATGEFAEGGGSVIRATGDNPNAWSAHLAQVSLGIGIALRGHH